MPEVEGPEHPERPSLEPRARESFLSKVLTRFVIPLVIFLIGVGGARAMFMAKGAAARDEPAAKKVVVEVIVAASTNIPAEMTLPGVVEPARTVRIMPEVNGKLAWRSKRLVPGAQLKKGEAIARLDGRDYALAVRQQKSLVRKAQLDLQVERGQGKIAKQEWDLLGTDNRDNLDQDLILRKPHLEAAKAALKSAIAGLGRARLSLSRTSIYAPFNATVESVSADVGQVVGPGTPITQLMGSDEYWVRVSVPVQRVRELRIPGVNAETGSQAQVFQTLDPDGAKPRVATLVRLLSRLDADTRTAQVLVSIKDPLSTEDGRLPVLPGSYVNVKLSGKRLGAVFIVPRQALYEGSKVWYVDRENRLRERRVQVRFGDDTNVYLAGEIKQGDRIVVSPIAVPIIGQRVQAKAAAKPSASGAAPASASSGSREQ